MSGCAGGESISGPQMHWILNYDLVVFTTNGRRATHAMAIEFTKHPAGIQPGAATRTGVMSMKSPRLRKTEAAKLKLAHISLQVEHYTGPKKFKPPASEVQQSDTGSQLLSVSLTKAQSKDAAYFSQLHFENPMHLWSTNRLATSTP